MDVIKQTNATKPVVRGPSSIYLKKWWGLERLATDATADPVLPKNRIIGANDNTQAHKAK